VFLVLGAPYVLLNFSLHNATAAPSSQLKKPKPSGARKMLKGIQLLSGGSGIWPPSFPQILTLDHSGYLPTEAP
jgi:hypothetical protein